METRRKRKEERQNDFAKEKSLSGKFFQSRSLIRPTKDIRPDPQNQDHVHKKRQKNGKNEETEIGNAALWSLQAIKWPDCTR